MKTKSFTSEADLIKFVGNNYDVIDAYTDDKSLSSRRLHRSKASQEKKILGLPYDMSRDDISFYANELRDMIFNEYANYPAMKTVGFRSMFKNYNFLNEDGLYNINLRFNFSKMYKENKFKGKGTWESFMPILWEYGWSWGSRKNNSDGKYFSAVTSTVNPRGGDRMSYAYFAGTHAISDAIAKFNKKHAADGIYARFMIGDTNIELYPGNKHKPYKKKAIEF